MTQLADTRTAIVLLTLDQRDLTLRCLDSLSRVEGPEHVVMVWDNGSADGTSDAIAARFPDVLVHHHPENIGVASGRNAAVEFVLARERVTHLLFLDNDMTVEPDFLGPLVEATRGPGGPALATGKIRDIEDHARLYGAGGCRIRFWCGDTMHVGHREIDRGQYDRPRPCIPSGGCLMVRLDVFRDLGGFDRLFDPYGPEDLDLGLRARRAGHAGEYRPESVVYHATRPGRTFDSGSYSRSYATLRARHWLQFLGRHASWLQKAGFYGIGAPWLAAKLAVREARRGNLGPALGGLLRGGLQFLRGRKR
jgi:GT2 family glycosyltransferase